MQMALIRLIIRFLFQKVAGSGQYGLQIYEYKAIKQKKTDGPVGVARLNCKKNRLLLEVAGEHLEGFRSAKAVGILGNSRRGCLEGCRSGDSLREAYSPGLLNY